MGGKKKKYPVEHMDVTVDPTMVSDNKTKESPSEISRYQKCHVDRLIHALDRFLIDHPEATMICEFYNSHNIPRRTYYGLLENWSSLREAHEKTMEMIGARLLSRSINFKANWNPVKFMIHAYGPDFSAAKEFDAMLAAKARESVETSNGPQIVVIEKFADSPIVKEKK